MVSCEASCPPHVSWGPPRAHWWKPSPMTGRDSPVLGGWLSSRSSQVKGICVRTGMSADNGYKQGGVATHCSLQRATNAALSLPDRARRPKTHLNNVVTLSCLTCRGLAPKRETKREQESKKKIQNTRQAEFLTSHVLGCTHFIKRFLRY